MNWQVRDLRRCQIKRKEGRENADNSNDTLIRNQMVHAKYLQIWTNVPAVRELSVSFAMP